MNYPAKLALLMTAIGLTSCGEESSQAACPDLRLYNVRDASVVVLTSGGQGGQSQTTVSVWSLPEFREAVRLGCVTPPTRASQTTTSSTTADASTD
jgi:hypothetical protein